MIHLKEEVAPPLARCVGAPKLIIAYEEKVNLILGQLEGTPEARHLYRLRKEPRLAKTTLGQRPHPGPSWRVGSYPVERAYLHRCITNYHTLFHPCLPSCRGQEKVQVTMHVRGKLRAYNCWHGAPWRTNDHLMMIQTSLTKRKGPCWQKPA